MGKIKIDCKVNCEVQNKMIILVPKSGFKVYKSFNLSNTSVTAGRCSIS